MESRFISQTTIFGNICRDRYMKIFPLIIFFLVIINTGFAQPIQNGNAIPEEEQPGMSSSVPQDPGDGEQPLSWDSLSAVNPLNQNGGFSNFDYEGELPPPFDPDVDDAVPVDGGLSLLLAAGLGLGAKRVYSRRKKEKAAQASKDV